MTHASTVDDDDEGHQRIIIKASDASDASATTLRTATNPPHHAEDATAANPISRSTSAGTGLGAPVIGSVASLVALGNASTDAMDLAPHSIATNRSKPMAKPPCGGAPARKASKRWWNVDSHCAGGHAHHALQHEALQPHVVDADRPSPQLRAVAHQVKRRRL